MFSYEVPLFYDSDRKGKSSWCGTIMTFLLVSITLTYSSYLILDTQRIERYFITEIEYDLSVDDYSFSLRNSETKLFAVLWKDGKDLSRE